MYDFISVVAVVAETWKPTRRPRCGKTLADHEILFVFRPAGRPGPDQVGPKKAGEPAGHGLAWTASCRPDWANARTGSAGLLRPLPTTDRSHGSRTSRQRYHSQLRKPNTLPALKLLAKLSGWPSYTPILLEISNLLSLSLLTPTVPWKTS